MRSRVASQPESIGGFEQGPCFNTLHVVAKNLAEQRSLNRSRQKRTRIRSIRADNKESRLGGLRKVIRCLDASD